MTPEQPVALVTGASRGIGRGIALALAKAGHHLVLNYASNLEAARETGQRVRDAGVECILIQGDISRPGDRERIFAETKTFQGRLDLLVNNAGIAPRIRKDILESDEGIFDEVLGTNLKGPYFLTQSFAKWMLDLKNGGVVPHPRIVFITSISAYAASVNRGEYCISKAGLSMTVQLFASRLASEGIPVFEVRPGIIATDMTQAVKEKYDSLIADGLVPWRRWGTPEDVARVVTAIARGDLDFSTGQIIEAGGGFSMRQL